MGPWLLIRSKWNPNDLAVIRIQTDKIFAHQSGLAQYTFGGSPAFSLGHHQSALADRHQQPTQATNPDDSAFIFGLMGARPGGTATLNQDERMESSQAVEAWLLLQDRRGARRGE